MTKYYIDLGNGTCGVLNAINKQDATTHTRREEGTMNTLSMAVRLATETDIDWHERMGGHIYETVRYGQRGRKKQ